METSARSARSLWGTWAAVALAAAGILIGGALAKPGSVGADPLVCPGEVPFAAGPVQVTVYFCLRDVPEATNAVFTFDAGMNQATLSSDDAAGMEGSLWTINSSTSIAAATMTVTGTGDGPDGSMTVTVNGDSVSLDTSGHFSVCLASTENCTGH